MCDVSEEEDEDEDIDTADSVNQRGIIPLGDLKRRMSSPDAKLKAVVANRDFRVDQFDNAGVRCEMCFA